MSSNGSTSAVISLNYRREKSDQFAKAKEEANTAKEPIRQALRQKLGMSEDDDIDFVVPVLPTALRPARGDQQIRVTVG